MTHGPFRLLAAIPALVAGAALAGSSPEESTPPPAGAPPDVWSLDGAFHASTPLRDRWCLNGLWGFRPPMKGDAGGAVPAPDGTWGWGKIPSVWEINTSWAEALKDNPRRAQTFHFAPEVEARPEAIAADNRAWFRRTFTMPPETAGRRVVLAFTMLNTRAVVYVDGVRAAEARFPGDEADITAFVRPGAEQTIDLLVTAYPFSKETQDFNAPDRAETKKSTVACKGVTGDLYLDALPKGPRIASGTVECDVAGGRATFAAELAEAGQGPYRLAATVRPAATGRKARDSAFAQSALLYPDASGRISFTASVGDLPTWDVHTPGNLHECALSLLDADGTVLDAALPFRFGFRDVRIVGRDLLLNGVPIHLRALHSGAMNGNAGAACAESAAEAIRRFRADDFNHLIADNYNLRPGSLSYLDDLLDVCDREGFLVSFSLPHIRDFGESTSPGDMLDDPQNRERYRELAEWAIRRVRNHPCVILWAMNHNMAGYAGDMNPLRIDGLYDPAPAGATGQAWIQNTRRNCHAAWEIAKSIDATRPVYHHESGNLDEFHTVNIYLNWAPVQERSDWLRHWAETGVKPLFFVEWGMPHIASWSSHRGPSFIHRVPEFQSLWASEFAAAFRGDAAYEGDAPGAVAALEREESLWAEGEPFPFWKISLTMGGLHNNYDGVVRTFMSDNWRSHRAWGITALLPWDQARFRPGRSAPRENPARWRGLKEPGIVPDRLPAGDWISGLGEDADFPRNAVGETIARWNRDDCAFIGGDGVFTDKTHHFRPGDEVRKTLVILNDRRVPQTVTWECALRGTGKTLRGDVRVEPGTRRDVPVAFTLPDRPGRHAIAATFRFENGGVQTDEFTVETYAPAPRPMVGGLALYDPKGLTATEFGRLGIRFTAVPGIDASLPVGTPLAIGRECLTSNLLYSALVPRARAGGRILVFEQTKETLESLGFRVQTYGLRDVFPRSREARETPGLHADALRDWNGESTLVPPYLENLAAVEMERPTDTWAGFRNFRVWRCGNRGCVATVLPEKPTLGDWMPLADGGFDLQYAPLLEWRLLPGSITFCQLDVTGRTAPDPVAEDLVRHLVKRLPSPDGRTASGHLYRSGASLPPDLRDRVAAGENALCLGFTKEEVAAWSPATFAMAPTNHCYAARIEVLPPQLDGLSNADWQWHGSMDFDAFLGRRTDGNAALRVVPHGRGSFVFWQVPPEAVDEKARPYLRTSKRRAQFMLSRLAGNLGIDLGAPDRIGYADIPEANDDPYRYYRW